MQHAETIIIKRPGAEVWALVGDPLTWERWIPGVTDVRLEGGGTPSEGASLSYTRRGKRQEPTVAAFEAELVIGIRGSEKNYEFSQTMSLGETFGGTRATLTMEIAPTAWWVSILAILMLPVKGLMIGRPLRKTLEGLRAALG